MGNHFSTAKKHIRRSPYQALSAILIMTLTFFVATILAVLAYGSHQTLKYFETRPQIIVFLKNEATPDQTSELQRQLTADSRIKGVRYVTKEEALEIYRSATEEKPLLSELVSPQIFPASLEFSVTDLMFAQDVINEVKQKEIVNQVSFTASLGGTKSIETVINNLRTITNYIRIGGSAILAFLLMSSLVILLVILSMRISSRREEIEILQLIGATPGFIRVPFLLEGIFYAFVGAFVGWLVGLLLILYAMPSITTYFNEVPAFPDNLTDTLILFGILLGVEFLLATVLGLLGSLVAIKRYLR